MCRTIRTLGKTISGDLTFCIECKQYHLSFNNIFFDFNKEELDQFKKYIFNLDIDYWEEEYECPKFKRNIPIPSLQRNLILLFNRQEIEELKRLLSYDSNNPMKYIRLDEIDYKIILN